MRADDVRPARGRRIMPRRKWVKVAPGCTIVVDGTRHRAGERVNVPAKLGDDLCRRGSARLVV